MFITLLGKVISPPVCIDTETTFYIKTDQGIWKVVSENRQAYKDEIFVQTGQKILVEGQRYKEDDEQSIVVSKKAKIQQV